MVLIIHKYLLCCLIAMIAFQSVDAISYSVNFYQPKLECAEADYFQNLSIEIDKNTPPTSMARASTEHCCYCHGSMSLPAFGILLHDYSAKSEGEIADCGIIYTSQLITPDLRPPII